MKRDYTEYGKTHKLPEGYDLRMGDITEMLKEIREKDTDELIFTLVGIYKHGFDRGRMYEKKRQENT